MDPESFDCWLAAYGRAWEGRDPEAAARLFTPNALYYWTPFEAAKKGRTGITAAWREATSRQEDIHFDFEIFSIAENRGLAHWSCSLMRITSGKRVRLDGILQAEFDENGLCVNFREWWHSDERGAD